MKRRLFLALVLAPVALAARAQDYLREQRWEAEVLSSLVVGEPVRISLPPKGTFLGLYTQGRAGRPAVLLVHGSGVHPDHGVIGILRGALADRGLSTLSIQMPVLAADARAEDYVPLFPQAAERIAAAADWLKAKGHRTIVLASHSLGSWMSQYYLASASAAPFVAWTCMGRAGRLAKPARPIPILDVYGENDLPLVLRYAPERRRTLEHIPGSRQIVIAGADHFYTGKETELTEALLPFIEASDPTLKALRTRR
jgi:pimeloyl-ACP methyl ester carboxylesterase